MNTLNQLIHPSFITRFAGCGSAKVLHFSLGKSKEVRAARKALAAGVVSESSIERFANSLMENFQRGKQFPYDLTLTALCVILQNRSTKFVEDFLLDLARLRKFSEITWAPTIAGICLQLRVKTHQVREKRFTMRVVAIQASRKYQVRRLT